MTRIVVATSFASKLCGLLLAKPDGRLLVLPQCCDVHTFGMPYPLDLAFMDGSLHVMAVCRDVPPGRRVRCDGAWLVVERAASPHAGWYRPGSRAGPALRKALAQAWQAKGRRHPRGTHPLRHAGQQAGRRVQPADIERSPR